MGAKEVVSNLAKALSNSPLAKYTKYLNPYTPARYWADQGKKEYAIIYFFSWYVLAGLYFANKGKKNPEQK
ncbi:hypothetical protein FDP41_003936 [Naegleria fowleri]|uniref:Uncharacterized protein n=1 Tax=Naegleria fowleri TaxID=5763 RepID=A0A6A5BHD5_NAEFO|nr:uncharacterized protein FDP41_003936 [Naegleria fowleri]KAF0977283.1 hypothetical protein FDP41_003936 [Naegleria fowleri]